MQRFEREVVNFSAIAQTHNDYNTSLSSLNLYLELDANNPHILLEKKKALIAKGQHLLAQGEFELARLAFNSTESCHVKDRASANALAIGYLAIAEHFAASDKTKALQCYRFVILAKSENVAAKLAAYTTLTDAYYAKQDYVNLNDILYKASKDDSINKTQQFATMSMRQRRLNELVHARLKDRQRLFAVPAVQKERVKDLWLKAVEEIEQNNLIVARNTLEQILKINRRHEASRLLLEKVNQTIIDQQKRGSKRSSETEIERPSL